MKYISLLILVFISCLSLTAHAEDIKYMPDNMTAYNNYINVMLVDEINSFGNKNSSPLDNGILTVNASKVIEDYKINELKANRKYKGKEIRIKTVATKIKEGISNKPYIIANDKNGLSILLYIDPNDNRYLNIASGDEIDLVCKGGGVLKDSPIFNSCYFAKNYAQVIAIIVKKQTQLLTDDRTIKVTEYAKFLHMFYMINEKEIEKACINNDTKKCIMVILNLVNKKIEESDLKKYNIDLNKIR